jgi:regulator of sigma E protease
MEYLIQGAQLILSLSILVVLHEMGHFIPAKYFKTKVEKFYLFFDPWFSLFKFKKGETEYGVGWLPLGGYVKIAGMIDESMDKEQLKKPAEPWEFRSKPAWQRLIIMVGGVTVNLILGMVIYAGILFYYGERYLPNENVKDGIWAISDLAKEVGLETGDKIINVNGTVPKRFHDIVSEMPYGGNMEIERNGSRMQLEIPKDFVAKIMEEDYRSAFILPRFPFIISEVPDSSHNAAAGFKKGDIVTKINEERIQYADEFTAFADTHQGTQATLTVKRENTEIILPVLINEEGKIGVIRGMPNLEQMQELNIYELKTIEYGFFESFPAGIAKGANKLVSYVKQLKLMLNPETGAYKGLGGFGAIGGLFLPTWDWEVFWNITAFLSLILAVMNILPIPALDGGHVMFLTYEIITGRKPHDKVLEISQAVGMILLLALLVYANYNDIAKLF